MKLFMKACLIAALSGAALTACDEYDDTETPDNLEEVDKNLAGVWQLQEVSRNSVDITSTFNFSQFRLHLKADGSYSFDNRLPFPVSESGVWTVDDPKHPFVLSFTENGALGAAEVGIQYPIVNGVRQLTITHSPGCGENSYIYRFLKVND